MNDSILRLLDQGPLVLLAVAAVAVYLGGRLLAHGLSTPDERSALRVSVGNWLPTALVALLAITTGHEAVAVGVAFSTSVTALSLILGVVVVSAVGEIGPDNSARAWPMLVPAALLAWLIGFRAELTWLHALILLLQGMVAWTIWLGHDLRHREPALWPVIQGGSDNGRTRWIALPIGLLFAIAGAWLVLSGAIRLSESVTILAPGLVAATGLGPLLMLPLLGSALNLSTRNMGPTGASACVAIPLLNLTVLLPAIVLAWYVVQWLWGAQEASPLTYPLAVWRVDAVLLIVLGALLIPVAMGKWKLGKLEGAVLILAYVGYMLAATMLGTRR